MRSAAPCSHSATLHARRPMCDDAQGPRPRRMDNAQSLRAHDVVLASQRAHAHAHTGLPQLNCVGQHRDRDPHAAAAGTQPSLRGESEETGTQPPPIEDKIRVGLVSHPRPLCHQRSRFVWVWFRTLTPLACRHWVWFRTLALLACRHRSSPL